VSKDVILCVDDEVLILISLKHELRKYFGSRFTYETASGPFEALELLDELKQEGSQVVLVLSDWLMPGMRGDAFLEKARQEFPGMKALLISGQIADAELMKLQQDGLVSGMLSKPWNTVSLMNAVENCIGS